VETAHAYEQLRRAMFGASEASVILGRYTLLEMLGGTMRSEVFSAHDAQLDRVVALKLLPLRDVDHDGALEEARALAGIAHGNVVTVFDAGLLPAAETGDRFDRVYLAMELLTGPTLAAWLADSSRRWREIVDAFVHAGAGLCAAHRAGITHCDFKPENVIVTDAGTIKLVDFGLSHRGLADVSCRLERIAGTPAYMAPEQLDGAPLDPRVDQFAFCVALYEAVYRAPPFEGRTLGELAQRKRNGELRVPPAGAGPRFVWPILRRGLRADPTERWESMDAVVTKLRAGLARRRRATQAGVVVLASVGVVAAVAAARQPACDDGAQLVGSVWDERVRARVAQAFTESALPDASAAWVRASVRIDAWVQQWMRARASTCALPPERATAQRLCLDTQLYALSELTALLEQPDHRAIRGAPMAAADLPEVSACAQPSAVSGSPPPSSAFERELARAAAQYDLGRYGDAVAAAEAILARYGEEAGPLARARLDLVLGQARAKSEDVAGAEQALRRAWSQAERLDDARLAAWALVRLAWVLDEGKRDRDEAEALLDVVEAKLEPLGDPHDLQAEVSTLRGHFARAYDPGAAETHYRAALEAYRAAYGEDDRRVAESLANLGQVVDMLGRPAEAREHLNAALRVWEPLLSEMHPLRATTELSIGITYLGEGRPESALPHVQRAYEQAKVALGPRHTFTASSLGALAVVQSELGEHDAALAAMEASAAVLLERLGPQDMAVLEARCNLGLIHLELGDAERAREILDEVVDELDASEEPDEAVRSAALLAAARARVATGDAGTGEALARRALQIRSARREPALRLAEAEFVIATATIDRDPRGARALAEHALQAYATTDGHAKAKREIRAWLAGL
jgi:serine/threonine-protein kinase